MSTRCVFVGNIPYDATEEQLIQICEEVGPVVSFRLVIDKETGKPKGYGFCEFKDEETALSARRNLQGYEINGRQLRVDFAENDKSADRNREQGRGGPGFTSTTDAQRKQGSVRDPSLNQPVGIGAAVAAAVVMAGALGAPQVASFSGSGGQVGCDPLTSYLAGMSKSQLYEIISQMKEFIHQNQSQSRHILTTNPQLTKALFQAEIILGLVRPPQVMPNVLLQRPNMQNLSKPQFQMYGQHDPSTQFPRQPLQSQTLPLPKLPQQTPLHQVQGRVVPPQMLSQVQLESCPQTMSMQSLLQPPVPPPPQLQPQGMVAEAPQPSSLQQQPGVSSSQHLNLSLMQHPQPPKMNQVQPSGFAFQSSPFLQQPPFPQTLFQQSVGLPQVSSGLPFQTQVPPPLSSTHQPPQQPVHLSRTGAELNGDNSSTSQSGVGSQSVGPSPPTAWRNHVQPSLNGGGEIIPPLPMTGLMNPTTSTGMAMPSMLSSSEVSYSTGMNVNGSGNPSEAVTTSALTAPQGFSEPVQQKPQQPQLQIPQELEAQKELLQQVLNLTAEQISSLPPEQRDQVIQLQKTLRGQ